MVISSLFFFHSTDDHRLSSLYFVLYLQNEYINKRMIAGLSSTIRLPDENSSPWAEHRTLVPNMNSLRISQ